MRNIINKKSSNVISLFLVLTVFTITSISTVNLISSGSNGWNANNVSVQKIDDNKALIHSDSVKTAENDFWFRKSTNSDGTFKYNISGLESKGNGYEFSSPMDITITDGLSSNKQLGAGIWALASGATGAAAAGAIGGILSGAGVAGTAAAGAATVVAAGATSATTVGSFAAGAQLAGAVILTAAGPGAIIAGAGAIVGLG